MNIFRIFGSKQAIPSNPPTREIKPRPTETEMLIREINSSHAFTRLHALSRYTRQIEVGATTSSINVEDIVPVLVKIFSEKPVNQDACECSARLLGDIRDKLKVSTPETLPTLVKVIENKDKFSPYVRGRALVAIGYFGKEAKDTIPLIISSLGDKDPFVEISAGAALNEIAKESKEDVKKSLVNHLNDSNDQIRGSSVASLGIIFRKEAKDALEILIKGLSDKSEHVRRSCALALGYIGQEAKDSIPGLVKLLADKSKNVTETTTWALTEIAKEL